MSLEVLRSRILQESCDAELCENYYFAISDHIFGAKITYRVDNQHTMSQVLRASSDGEWSLGEGEKIWPIYRANLLKRATDTRWMLVKDEVTADLLSLHLPIQATTSICGLKHFEQTDWSILGDREVWIVQEPGEDYSALAKHLFTDCWCRVNIIDTDRPLTALIPEKLEQSIDGTVILDGLLKNAVAFALEAEKQKQTFLVVASLDQIKEEPVKWVWPNRIMSGALNLIAGEPGCGKSYLSLWLASQMSLEETCYYPGIGANEIPHGESLFICSEDSPSRISHRARLLGASMSKIHLLTGVNVNNELHPFDLRTHLDLLRSLLDRNQRIKMVVLDPVKSFMSGVDDRADPEVRAALQPLNTLAQERDLAVIAISHTRKLQKGTGAKDSILGSVAFVAVSRMCLGVCDHKDRADIKMLTNIKCNESGPQPPLYFSFVGDSDDAPTSICWDPFQRPVADFGE